MKPFYRVLWTLLLLSAPIIAMAQPTAEEGKPLYRIVATRGAEPLGEIILELFPDIAPLHVRNFDSLVAIDFYDGTAFHRVIPGFVIQGGDPNSRSGPESTWGYGDPSQHTVPAEFNPVSHRRGILSAARAQDINSATSQFFICHANATNLDNNYTVYGRVVSGMSVVDTIALSPRNSSDRPLVKISMQIDRIGIDTTPVETPQVRLPVDGAVNVPASVSFSWDSVPGAILYRVQVSTSSDFLTDTIVETTRTTVSLSALKQGATRYYWRVSASNGGRHSDYTPVRTFVTGVAAPKIEAPASGTTVTSTEVNLRWKSVVGATGYRLQIAPTLAFTSFLVDSVGITDTTAVVRNLVSGTRYYWRVAAMNDTSFGPFSGNGNFTIDATTAVGREMNSTLTRMELLGADQPTATVSLTLAQPADVRLVLSNLSGEELHVVRPGALSAGEHRIPVDLSELPSGTYLLRLETSGTTQSRIFQIGR